MKQKFLVLYNESQATLTETIEKLLQEGQEIILVTNISTMKEPKMNGVTYADWLIIYRVREYVIKLGASQLRGS